MWTRGALKDLQASATDKTSLVGSPVCKRAPLKQASMSDKFSKKGRAKMPKEIQKENCKSRKNAKTEKVPKISKYELKKSSLKLKKGATSSSLKINEISTTTQSTSHNSCDVEVSSKFDFTNVTVNQDVSDVISIVSSDSYSYSYWQNLAEQRQIAFEKTLLENEQLFDQLAVLQAENSLLKSALDSAENLLKMEGFLE